MSYFDYQFIAYLFRVVFQNDHSGYLEPVLLVPGSLENDIFSCCSSYYAGCNAPHFRELNSQFIYGFPLCVPSYLEPLYESEYGEIDMDNEDMVTDFYSYVDSYYEDVCQNYQIDILKNSYSFYIDTEENVHIIQMNPALQTMEEVSLLDSFYQNKKVCINNSSKLVILYPNGGIWN